MALLLVSPGLLPQKRGPLNQRHIQEERREKWCHLVEALNPWIKHQSHPSAYMANHHWRRLLEYSGLLLPKYSRLNVKQKHVSHIKSKQNGCFVRPEVSCSLFLQGRPLFRRKSPGLPFQTIGANILGKAPIKLKRACLWNCAWEILRMLFQGDKLSALPHAVALRCVDVCFDHLGLGFCFMLALLGFVRRTPQESEKL